MLAKLLVTPTPRVALVAAKAFAAGIRAVAQAVIVLALALLLGVGLSANPLHWLGVVVAMLLGARVAPGDQPRQPLSYEVDALRGLLIGTPGHLWLDFAVLVGSSAPMITGASALLPRLVRG